MWRWSSAEPKLDQVIQVFSTYVEVILNGGDLGPASGCILHVCGGDPTLCNSLVIELKYSPRMWRWSYDHVWNVRSYEVFSTYVEVIPAAGFSPPDSNSILHVCGGDPNVPYPAKTLLSYSPRMWRWSQCAIKVDDSQLVFSTYVEVILFVARAEYLGISILHVCGGDP